MDERFKTLRHIETVRNYLSACVRELLTRAERHDQTKLQSPEREMFDESEARAALGGSAEGYAPPKSKLSRWAAGRRKARRQMAKASRRRNR